MASGVSGYVEITDNSITFRIYYSETYNISSKRSALSITKVKVKSSSYVGLYYLDGSIKVNGTTAVDMDSFAGTHSIYIGRTDTFYDISGTLGSVNIARNSSGSVTVPIELSTTAYFDRDSGSTWSISGNRTISLTSFPENNPVVPEGTTTDLFTVNGLPMLPPDKGVSVSYEDIDASDSGRDESGIMHRIVLRHKVATWNFSYSHITEEQRQYMESIFPDAATFTFRHPSRKDATVFEETECYRRKVGISWKNAVTGTWSNYNFLIVQC